jgi:hypothetical protein
MAFRANVRTHALRPNAPIAYMSPRNALGNPPRDEAQIVAVGRTASPIVEEPLEVVGQRYDRWCDLEFEAALPLREGLPFRPLVEELAFIANKLPGQPMCTEPWSHCRLRILT